jgi:hypothetical protein
VAAFWFSFGRLRWLQQRCLLAGIRFNSAIQMAAYGLLVHAAAQTCDSARQSMYATYPQRQME